MIGVVYYPMKTIFLLVGTKGQYDSYEEWVAKAFVTQAGAEAHREKIKQWQNGNGIPTSHHEKVKLPKRLGETTVSQLEDKVCPFDSHLQWSCIDRSGIEYEIREVELE